MSLTRRDSERGAGVILALAATLLLLVASPAAAHTGFVSSSPADGETTSEPVTEISLIFSGDASPAGDGFVVLDPEGVVRAPDEVASSDNLTWTLRFDEPLVDGVVGVRWKVAAPDAHPIEGSFSFTVDAPALLATPTTTAQTVGSAPTPTTSTAVAPQSAEDEAPDSPTENELSESLRGADSTSVVALDDFLATGESSATGVARVGDVGRVIGLLGFVLAFGGVVFAALVLRGEQGEIRAVLFWVRRAGILAMVGVAISATAHVADLASSWSSLWSPSALGDALVSTFGVAVVLRIAGGALIATGAKLDVHSADAAVDPINTVRQLTTVGAGLADGVAAGSSQRSPIPSDDDAWHIQKSPAAFVGAALLALSYLFDGHTVSEGPRWLHGLANMIHVTTAATWAGGVMLLALVIVRRHRHDTDTRALQLAVRFSVVATVALVAASAAGIALTVVILDSVSEIWATPWGRLLIAKVLLVGAAAAGGGYNHWIVIPALGRSPDDQAVAHRFRTIVTLEAVALVAATLVTGLLIAASSV